MSTGQALGVVGAAIGGYFFGPAGAQWGYMIGSTIGNAIDPEIIRGPDIGDARQQTSQAGMGIPKVYGMPAPFAGTIVDGDPVARKYTKRDDGKGGPVTETQHFKATRAILVCEGVADFGRIFRNGKLVYSTVDGDTLDADSANFASQLRLYRGTQDQLPDPSLEALHGVGNTPAFPGRAYVVVVDDDETQTGGAANQYLFQMAIGSTQEVVEHYAVQGYSRFTDADFPLLNNPETDYTFITNVSTVGTQATTALSDAIQWAIDNDPYTEEPTHLVGYLRGPAGPWSLSAEPMIHHGTVDDLSDRKDIWLCYQYFLPSVYYDDLWINGGGDPLIHYDGNLTAWRCDSRGSIFRFTGPASYEARLPVAIEAFDERIPPNSLQPGEYLFPDTPLFAVTVDGVIRSMADYDLVVGSFKCLALELSTAPGIYDQRQIGPVLVAGSAEDTEAFWDAAYADAVADGTAEAGKTYSASGAGDSTTYPRNISSAYKQQAVIDHLDPTIPTWQEIAEDIVSRTPMPAAKLDAAIMTDGVPGFLLARADLTGVDYLRSMCGPYFISLPEYDGGLHAIRFGGAVVETITDDDLLEVEFDDDDQRKQQIEAPVRISIMYPDPDNNYVGTPQTALRTSPDIQGSAEQTVQTIIPFDKDLAAQIVDKMQKVAYSKVEGGFTRALPAKYLHLVPSDPIMFHDKRHVIDLAKYEDSMVTIQCSYDRASDYQSIAIGSHAPTPTPQSSNMKGPSVLQPMNLPSLRTSDNVPGVYLAVQGLLPGWTGADIYLSVDGGETEALITTMNDAAVIGELNADIDADDTAFEIDPYYGGELSSVTDAQLAARLNGFALITDDVAEVGQFKTAVADGDFYDLSEAVRGQLGTEATVHYHGDRFVKLDSSIRFVPIDISHAGKTLIFRAVTRGTAPASNTTVSLVFNPIFTSVTVSPITVSGVQVTVGGQPIYVVT